MAFDTEHGHAALRSGRWSESGADYFLTFCTFNRLAGLNDTLVNLGDDFGLAQVVRLFKGRLSLDLRKHDLRWQKAYFDHRLRLNDDALRVFLYIYLNAYRAGLVAADEKWPAYFCCPEDWSWFQTATNQSGPYPEWLA